MATVDRLGCGKLHVTGASQNLLVDGSYATVTLDTGFDGVPASSSVPTSWGFTAAWATADACAHPNAYAPILLVGKPLAPKAKCPPTAGCTAMTLANPNAAFGASTTAGCSTITPTAAGYMTLTQWAGGKPGQVTASTSNKTNCFPSDVHSLPDTLLPCFVSFPPSFPVHGLHRQRYHRSVPGPMLGHHRPAQLLPRGCVQGKNNLPPTIM